MPHFIAPYNQSFTQTVHAHISQTHPDNLQNVLILTPSARAAKALTQAFLNQNTTSFLPKIQPLNPNEDDLAANAPPQAVITPHHRLLFLRAQVAARAQLEGLYLPPDRALAAAHSLSHLLNQFMQHGVTAQTFTAALAATGAQNLEAHSKNNLLFVEILLHSYPQYLKANNLQDPALHQHTLFTLWAERLTQHDGPIYVIGVQDTTPAGHHVLTAVNNHPQGHFIFPAHAPLPQKEEPLSPEHPNAATHNLLQTLNIAPESLTTLPTHTPYATQYTSLTLPTAQDELRMVTLLLQEAAHTNTPTLLVTPDPVFGLNIKTQLTALGIVADDGAGTALTRTPLGSYLLRTLTAAATPSPTNLAALITHPHFQAQYTLTSSHIHAFDALALRGLPPTNPTLHSLQQKLTAALTLSYPKPHETAATQATQTLEALTAHLTPLQTAAKNSKTSENSLTNILNALQTLITELPTEELTTEALQTLLQNLTQEADLWPNAKLSDAAALLTHHAQYTVIRSPQPSIIRIRGPLQARYETAERIILTNLTSNTWPTPPTPDAWLNPRLAEALNLPNPAITLGLSAAHFWALAGNAPEVFLTRSATIGGLAVPPSHLLAALQNSPHFTAQQTAAEARATTYHTYLTHRYGPTDTLTPYTPEPTLPDTLTEHETWSASFIEGLMACPYRARLSRFYHLQPPEPYNAEEDARQKGLLFHACLQAFFTRINNAPKGLPKPFPHPVTSQNIPAAITHFMQIADVYLAQINTATAGLWRARLATQAQDLFTALAENHTQNRTPTAFEARAKLPLGAITLTATADRIDTQHTNSILVDYKTGTPPSFTDIKNGKKPQLLIEALLAHHGAFGDAHKTPTAVEYWQLGSGKAAFTTKPEPITEDLLQLTQTSLHHLQTHHASSSFTAIPAGLGQVPTGVCTQCHFAPICRFKQFTPQPKNQNPTA